MLGLFKEIWGSLFNKETGNGGYNREWTRSMIHSGIKSYKDEEDDGKNKSSNYEEEIVEEKEKEEDILEYDFTKLSTDKRKLEDSDEE
ncbi:MAG TPA: hypothetical protein DEP72_02235 [Clostridiales bacterium]|nr:MAG: hypothetical protein A2Y18_00425 [Clostridiales bacterium GWD2_32_19]HCC06975.1 hypothetical protein [Clostridiales bacterium]